MLITLKVCNLLLGSEQKHTKAIQKKHIQNIEILNLEVLFNVSNAVKVPILPLEKKQHQKYLIIEAHVHHQHLSSDADPSRAAGVVRVHATSEPNLDTQPAVNAQAGG